LLIKDLWIISTHGLSVYHYHSPQSNYQLDDTLFSGFIAALSTFAESLSQKHIDFLKLENDEIYFVTNKEVNIIVVSIINTTAGGTTEEHVIEQLLHFVGEKFVESFGHHLEKVMFDFDLIADTFTKEIEFITADDRIYEELKREMINKLLSEVITGKISPDVLHWKVASLFSNSTHQEIQKTIEMFDNLSSVLSTVTNDVVLESKLSEAFQKATFQLKRTLFRDESKKQLYVLCQDEITFHNIFNNFLKFGTACSYFNSAEALEAAIIAVNKYIKGFNYNILVVQPTITTHEAEILSRLQTDHSIIIWTDNQESEVQKLFETRSNIKIEDGYCDLEHGCPKIFKILKQFSDFYAIT
jgi:hypothetical protein